MGQSRTPPAPSSKQRTHSASQIGVIGQRVGGVHAASLCATQAKPQRVRLSMNPFLPNLGAGYWLRRYTGLAGKATSAVHTERMQRIYMAASEPARRLSLNRPQCLWTGNAAVIQLVAPIVYLERFDT